MTILLDKLGEKRIMLVFSLDEQGDFEYISGNDEAPVFIGGILFDDKCFEGEISIEEKRIEAYYKAICKQYSTQEVQLDYPMSLHSNGKDNYKVAIVKKGVSCSIKEFLESGTFNGEQLIANDGTLFPRRKGVYYPYVFMKSDLSKDHYNKKKYYFMYEKTASNLYYHMVKDTIRRVVCQLDRKNDDGKYILHIATRSTPSFPRTDNRKVKYEEAGYSIITTNNDNSILTLKDEHGNDVKAFRVQLTNKDVYRTVIREILTQQEMYDADIKMDVKSISYYRNDSTNTFLYLADSICSLISYKLGGKTADERFLEILNRTKNIINPSRFFVFGYDPVDDCYSKSYDAMLKGDIYNAYYYIFMSSLLKNEFAVYYKNNWFKKLEKLIEKKLTNHDIELTLLKIEKSQKSNCYDIDSSKFILDHILNICEKVNMKNPKKIPGELMFRLYDVAITSYSHLGSPEKSKESYSKALRYSYFASAEAFLRVKNKMVVILCDCFEFEEAKKISEQNLILQEKISEFKSSIIEILQPEQYMERNKALSQMAQVYAFMRDKKAENIFIDALINMKKNTANYYITESYLLHFYIDNGLKEKYEKKAVEYFGGNDNLEEQLEYIISQGNINNRMINISFALYLYTKSLWFFYRDSINENLLDKLRHLDKYVKNEKNRYIFKSHPNELILKYLMLLMLFFKEEKAFNRYNKLYDACLEGQGNLVQCIGMFGKLQINMKIDSEKEYPDLYILASKMFRTVERLNNIDIPNSKDELWELLNSLFVYMYV